MPTDLRLDTNMALTDTALKALKPTEKPTKHSDGGGLHVLLSPQGSKLWRLSYRFDGKQQTMALGAYPAVTLADARRLRENAKALLVKGINPSHHAKLERITKRASNAVTFKVVAEEYLVKIAKEGKADTTQNKKEWLLVLPCPTLVRAPFPKSPPPKSLFR